MTKISAVISVKDGAAVSAIVGLISKVTAIGASANVRLVGDASAIASVVNQLKGRVDIVSAAISLRGDRPAL